MKACLLSANLLSLEQSTSLRDQLRGSLSSSEAPRSSEVGLEVETWSELPLGSGLGGSSILGAAILASMWRISGRNFTQEDLIYTVQLILVIKILSACICISIF